MSNQQRVVSPDAPAGCIDPAMFKTHSGLEILNKMVAGEIPGPHIGRLMNFKVCEVGEGFAEFRGIPLIDHYNPGGSVHGGWAATIMDSALACAVHTTCAAGEASTTVEFKVNLVRPVLPGMGELACEGRVVHRGRNLAVSEATLKGPDGRTLAFGTETCSILRMPG